MNQRAEYLAQRIRLLNESKYKKQWIFQNIIKQIEYLNDSYKGNEEFEQETPREGIIMSVSDVGIHNMKKKDKEYHFFDFEYAGKDDSAKLFCDMILQPRHMMDSGLYSYALDIYISGIVNNEPKEQWLRRTKVLARILKLKWMIIMCNSIIREKAGLNEKDILRLDEYRRRSQHELLEDLY